MPLFCSYHSLGNLGSITEQNRPICCDFPQSHVLPPWPYRFCNTEAFEEGLSLTLKKHKRTKKPNFSANGEFFLQPYNKYIFVLSLNLVVLNLFYFLMTQACIKTLLWIDFCHRPALRYVYMLEFHPSLGLASRVYEALQSALKVCIFPYFCNLHAVFLGGFFEC